MTMQRWTPSNVRQRIFNKRETTPHMLDHCRDSGQTRTDPGFAFHQVWFNILNPNSLAFVAANAPADAVSSFQVHQQKVASLSLHVASTMLVRQLLRREGNPSSGSFSHVFHSVMSKGKSAFLLVACTFARVGLDTVRALRFGIPRRLQLFLSATILTKLGSLLTDHEVGGDPVAQGQIDTGIAGNAIASLSAEQSDLSSVAEDILRALNVSLPNDLSRLIFVATLRDNNSGHYYHPELVRRFSPEVADQAMLACHRQIYQQVVELALEDLTDQLDVYMATVRAPRERLIESWTKLRAYRATIPMDADPISAEIFFMKVEVAVAILGARLPYRNQR